MEAEAPSQPHAHPLGRGCAVERLRDRRPPVDDDRIAARVPDVPTTDVERLAVVAVGPAEEGRGVGVGSQRVESPGAQPAEALAGQLVDPVVRDALGAGAHGVQAAPGQIEVGTLGEQNGVFGPCVDAHG